ncbi:MAG: hypothetical protein KC466_15980, partial [Myxococcales bacterium]|nr:hypothetical protein [Myxococcales bacterium]
MRSIVRRRAIAVAAVAVGLLASERAWALDWDWSANAYQRFSVERHRFDPLTRRFSEDREPYSALADLTLRVYPTDRLRASVTLDTGELSERTLEGGRLRNDAERNGFVREAYVTYAGDRWGLHLGKRGTVAGRSYILDDFLVGADAWAELPRTFGLRPSVEGIAAIPEDLENYSGDVPIFTWMGLHLDISLFDRLTLFGAWLLDRDDVIARGLEREVLTVDRRFAITDARSRGDLYWFGAEWDFLLGPLNLSGLFIWEQGRADLDLRLLLDGALRPIDRRIDLKTEGFLVDVEVSYGLTERLFVSLWYLMASGEGDVVDVIGRGRTYRSFLGVRPFITRTNLFFSGGLSESLSTRTNAVSGTEGRGFIAPGLTTKWTPREDLYLEYKFAY